MSIFILTASMITSHTTISQNTLTMPNSISIPEDTPTISQQIECDASLVNRATGLTQVCIFSGYLIALAFAERQAQHNLIRGALVAIPYGISGLYIGNYIGYNMEALVNKFIDPTLKAHSKLTVKELIRKILIGSTIIGAVALSLFLTP